MMDLEKLVRRNIWKLQPYSSARSEFQGDASIFLDANENPYNTEYNRYPDPMQRELKKRIGELKGIDPECIFLGNGSDEAIDLVYRVFCEPGIDSVVGIDPSYGMYEVLADINNVTYVKTPLTQQFNLNADSVLKDTSAWVKVIFLCTPNNPTGNDLQRFAVYEILEKFQGIVVIDEAYGDFSPVPSYIHALNKYPNLIVLQTLSKAWGAAGLRLGMAFASKEIIDLMNKVKYPYNISTLTQKTALEVLNNEEKMLQNLHTIQSERARLVEALRTLPLVYDIYPSAGNFILIKVVNSKSVYSRLLKRGIVVRDRSNATRCMSCLRITIGTPEENDALLAVLRSFNYGNKSVY